MRLRLGRLRTLLKEALEQEDFARDEATGSIFCDPVVQTVVEQMRGRGLLDDWQYQNQDVNLEETPEVKTGDWVLHWFKEFQVDLTEDGVWAMGQVVSEYDMALSVKFLSVLVTNYRTDETTHQFQKIATIWNWLKIPEDIIESSQVASAIQTMIGNRAEVEWRPDVHLPEDDYSL